MATLRPQFLICVSLSSTEKTNSWLNHRFFLYNWQQGGCQLPNRGPFSHTPLCAAHPAGVPEGGPGAKAGEGQGGGAAQGWHGDPRPHPQLCGKVSGSRAEEWAGGGVMGAEWQ